MRHYSHLNRGRHGGPETRTQSNKHWLRASYTLYFHMLYLRHLSLCTIQQRKYALYSHFRPPKKVKAWSSRPGAHSLEGQEPRRSRRVGAPLHWAMLPATSSAPRPRPAPGPTRPHQDAATRPRVWPALPAGPPAHAGPANPAAGGTSRPAPGPHLRGRGQRRDPPPSRGARSPPARAARRYRFRCSLKSAVSARRASRSWMGAGTMTPDSRAGGGLGAAILPLAARRAGRRRGAGGGGGPAGARAGEERAPQPQVYAAAAAAAPLQPRPGGERADSRPASRRAPTRTTRRREGARAEVPPERRGRGRKFCGEGRGARRRRV